MAIRKMFKQGSDTLPMMEKDELLDRINMLKNDRDKALVSFLYLSGCRVSEAVPYIVERNIKRRVKKIIDETHIKKDIAEPITDRITKGGGIIRKQIRVDHNIFKIVNVRSLKRRGHRPRTIPIYVKREYDFVQIFWEYCKKLDEDAVLFPLTRQRVYQILESVGLYPHYLRHLRATSLVVDYGFSAAELRQFFNWSSSAPADEYVHLNVQNLIDKMQKRNESNETT